MSGSQTTAASSIDVVPRTPSSTAGNFAGTPSSPTISLPQGVSNNHKGYLTHEGRALYHLGNQRFVSAESREQLDQILAVTSASLGVSVDYLGFRDFDYNPFLNTGLYDTRVIALNGNQFVLSFRASYIEALSKVDAHYFGALTPTLGTGSLMQAGNKEFNFNMGEPGPRGQAERAAFLGTAKYLHYQNYLADTTPGIAENIENDAQLMREDITANIPTETLELLRATFAGEINFNRGHLNVLRLMDAIDPAANASNISSWVLNQNGKNALTALKSNSNDAFVPANTLHAMNANTLHAASTSKNWFTPDGGAYVDGNGVENTKETAFDILSTLNGLGTPRLPYDLAFEGRTVEALNALFGKSRNNADFSANEINTAIAMGLIQVNKGSPHQTKLTTLGATFVNTTRPLSSSPPPGLSNPAELTPAQAAKKDFWNALRTFQDLGGAKYADRVEAVVGKANGNNGRYGLLGVRELANSNSADHRLWDQFGMRNVAVIDRIKLIDAAKIIANEASAPYWKELIEILPNRKKEHAENGYVQGNEVNEWLNQNNRSWMSNTDEAAKLAYQDTSFATPSKFSNGYKEPEMKPDVAVLLNKTTEALFGQAYGEMSNEDRKKAIYLLTHVHQVFVYKAAEYGNRSTPSYGGLLGSAAVGGRGAINGDRVAVMAAELIIKPTSASTTPPQTTPK